MSGRIRDYWEQNGGLPVFGYPIGTQHAEVIEEQSFQVQWFERNRLELHPENAAPYDVLLGRLSDDVLQQQGRSWQAFPRSTAQDECRFFAETGHNVCGDILRAWRAQGLELDGQDGMSEAENLALFGLPLSDVQEETLSDGNTYQVQWFERARFELHPENQSPYNVLLGLLGNEMRATSSDTTPTPVPTTIAPTATPVPMPGSDTGGSLEISSVSLSDPGTGDRTISLSAGWSNSWHESTGRANWDAAWLFVHYRTPGGVWHHATLSSNASDYQAGSGPSAAFSPVPNGTGVFLYRASDGSGPVHWDGVTLRWNAQQDGVQVGEQVEVRVLGLEMVAIPAGSFYAGDGTSIGRFYAGGDPSAPYLVTEDMPLLANEPGGLWADDTIIPLPAGAPGPTPWFTPVSQLASGFPTGYQSFYIMKHELTQGMYATFLSLLTPQQAQARYPTRSDFPERLEYPTAFRYTIVANSDGTYTAGAPDRANNWMNWEDVVAFSDWAGLRPMSELEYEKVCRGSGQTPVAGEYAWGTTNIQPVTGIAGTDGSGSETALPTSANAVYWPAPREGIPPMLGPVRVDIFQQTGASREQSGATYYGVLNMTGNIIEPVVTLGNNPGRAYTGLHGDGTLTDAGTADVENWPRIPENPAVTWGLYGYGFRGGDFYVPEERLTVSTRVDATVGSPKRLFGLGFRAVRTAP